MRAWRLILRHDEVDMAGRESPGVIYMHGLQLDLQNPSLDFLRIVSCHPQFFCKVTYLCPDCRQGCNK